MKSFKSFSKKLISNQAGQGATEYILLLVVVVALVVLFKSQIQGAVSGKLSELQSQIQDFQGN